MNKTENFIKRAREIHGDKYDYSEVEYINAQTKVKIICKEHGEFYQNANKHINLGRGCWDCGKISCVSKRSITKDEFLEEANKKHKNKFKYNLDNYKDSRSEIVITCPIHGEFKQRACYHLKSKWGCNSCNIDSKTTKGTPKERYIERYKNFHGDRYDYSLLPDKIKSRDTLKIICNVHGIFEQSSTVHYRSGCRLCGYESASDERRKVPKELKRKLNSYKRRVRKYFTKKGANKTKKNSQLLGCSWVELKEHLENNPYGFKIDQEGLDLDHIIPLSTCETEEDLIRLSHYTNLQLLPMKYNQHIKRTNPWDKEHFEEWLKTKKL